MKAARYIFVCVIIMAVAGIVCTTGCNGNSASVKPNNEMDNRLKTALDNQQAMKDQIQTMNGNLTKVQQTFNEVMNTVITTINQKFETFQDSVSNKIGEVGRDVNTRTSKSQNSTLYGIGLVAVVLAFALGLIWLLAKTFKQAALKLLK